MKYDLKFMGSADDYEMAYKDAVEFNRRVAWRIARELDRGETMDACDMGFVAMILREWADNLKGAPQRKPGKPVTFCHATAAVEWALKVRNGANKTEAKNQVAEELGVTVEAIRKVIKTNGKAAAEFVAMLPAPNPPTK